MIEKSPGKADKRIPGGPGSRWTDHARRLEERYLALRTEISEGLIKADREQYQELAGRVADTGEQAVADLLVDLGLAEIDRDVVELREVELAIRRLKQGRYGLCIDCGEDIDPRRLQSLPSAVRCMDCQKRLENVARETVSRSL